MPRTSGTRSLATCYAMLLAKCLRTLRSTQMTRDQRKHHRDGCGATLSARLNERRGQAGGGLFAGRCRTLGTAVEGAGQCEAIGVTGAAELFHDSVVRNISDQRRNDWADTVCGGIHAWSLETDGNGEGKRQAVHSNGSLDSCLSRAGVPVDGIYQDTKTFGLMACAIEALHGHCGREQRAKGPRHVRVACKAGRLPADAQLIHSLT